MVKHCMIRIWKYKNQLRCLKAGFSKKLTLFLRDPVCRQRQLHELNRGLEVVHVYLFPEL